MEQWGKGETQCRQQEAHKEGGDTLFSSLTKRRGLLIALLAAFAITPGCESSYKSSDNFIDELSLDEPPRVLTPEEIYDLKVVILQITDKQMYLETQIITEERKLQKLKAEREKGGKTKDLQEKIITEERKLQKLKAERKEERDRSGKLKKWMQNMKGVILPKEKEGDFHIGENYDW